MRCVVIRSLLVSITATIAISSPVRTQQVAIAPPPALDSLRPQIRHLLDSVHKFCDQAMEVFASAIDAKEYRSSPHSLRVGRYAAAMGSALGLNSTVQEKRI